MSMSLIRFLCMGRFWLKNVKLWPQVLSGVAYLFERYSHSDVQWDVVAQVQRPQCYQEMPSKALVWSILKLLFLSRFEEGDEIFKVQKQFTVFFICYFSTVECTCGTYHWSGLMIRCIYSKVNVLLGSYVTLKVVVYALKVFQCSLPPFQLHIFSLDCYPRQTSTCSAVARKTHSHFLSLTSLASFTSNVYCWLINCR